MIRTVIVDDHDLIRDGFKKLIAGEPDISLVGEAKNGSELRTLMHTEEIDVIVLDLKLPDIDGLEILKEIRQLKKPVRTLVLSMYSEDQYAKRALENGAAGYLTKAHATEELIRAIRKIYYQGRYITEKLAEVLAVSVAENKDEKRHELLSDREYQVLLLLGEGKKAKEIAEELYLSINTVNSYRRRLLEKLGLRSSADCVRYVLEHDLVT